MAAAEARCGSKSGSICADNHSSGGRWHGGVVRLRGAKLSTRRRVRLGNRTRGDGDSDDRASLFTEFEIFDFTLSGVATDTRAFGGLTLLDFDDASTAVPEPTTLSMLAVVVACVIGRHARGPMRDHSTVRRM